ncbi:MAG: photosystem II stability/assembly factor-like uncharacterized protein, partial [Gammaproteobacteria bacterium]
GDPYGSSRMPTREKCRQKPKGRRSRPVVAFGPRLHELFGLALSLVSIAAACTAPAGPEPQARESLLPQPTERGLDGDAEERKQIEREAWIEEMHRAESGTDWRAIESENQARALWRRNRRSASRAALNGPAGSGGTAAIGGETPAGQWQEIGSRNQAGHVRCAAMGYQLDGVRKLYVGTALGGVWRGNLDGTEWTPLSDHLWGGVDEVSILPPEAPGEPEVIVIRRGRIVYTSRDDGATWVTADGLGSQQSIRRMAVLDDAAHTILLLGSRNVSGGTKLALLASTDGGRTFAQRWVSITNGTSDMWVPQTGPEASSTVYTVHRGRIRRSVDGGATFMQQSVIDTTATEGYISGSEAGSPTLYVTLRIAGQWNLYRSDDAGVTTQLVQSNLGDYWGTMHAFPTDPMAVIFGGVEAHRSLDGGLTHQIVNTWGAYYNSPNTKLHADIRGMDVIKDAGGSDYDYGYICTDGGLYVTRDAGLTVLNLTSLGLGVGQFYSTYTSSLNPDRIVGGTQDQGYQRGMRQPPSGPGPSTSMNQLISGDYGHLTSGDGTHGLVYSTYPGFILVQEGETGPSLRFEDFPVGTNNLWLPPVVADPLDTTAFFFLARELYRYTRVNTNNWNPVQHSAQSFGGAGSYLSAMAFAPTDPQRAYAVNDIGRMWSSTDRGVTWTESATNGANSHYFYGSALAVHPTDALEAVVGGSGYSEPGVRRTLDGGVTWQPLIDGLPSTLTYDLTYAKDGTGDIYAATEIGAYRWRRDLEVWVDIMENDAPSTLYWSVEAVPALNRIRYGTYGRGIWDYEIEALDAGSITPYGTGLGGANVLSLDSISIANLGNTVQFDVTGGSAGRLAWLLQRDRQASVPFAGGTLLVQRHGLYARTRTRLDGNGEASFPFQLPENAALLGRQWFFQAIARDPSMVQGLALSNGLQMVIGQ